MKPSSVTIGAASGPAQSALLVGRGPGRARLAARPRLVTCPLLLRFVSAIGSAVSVYLLLSVVPLYAKSAGASQGAAGLATSALTLASVAGEMAAPRLMARFGYRLVLAVGLVMLGAPALLLAASASMGPVLAVCLAVGLGFGLNVVAWREFPGPAALLRNGIVMLSYPVR